jgi:hypothetical protein
MLTISENEKKNLASPRKQRKKKNEHTHTHTHLLKSVENGRQKIVHSHHSRYQSISKKPGHSGL